MLTRRSSIATGILAAGAALALLIYAGDVGGPHTLSATLSPTIAPPLPKHDDAWHWAAASPGVNLYVADDGELRDDTGRVSTWVRREYFRNLAGIDANILELRQFDCSRGTSRLVSSPAQAPTSSGTQWIVTRATSDWTLAQPGTAAERVLRLVCQHTASQW